MHSMKWFFVFVVMLLPMLTLAQGGELTVGERTVTYDASIITETGILYYQGDEMVASEREGMTLLYEDSMPILEAHDTNNDGTLDTFVTLDANEDMVEVTGEGAEMFTRPEAVEFAVLQEVGGGEAAAHDEEDLVGSLDSITIPKYQNYALYAWVLILAGGGYWYYRRKKRTRD